MVIARRVGVLVAVLAWVGAGAGRLNAHPLHSSYSEVVRERDGRISVSVRLFADDFGSLLDSLRSSSGTTREAVAQAYMARRLSIAANGSSISTEWCGIRSEQNLIFVCVRTVAPVVGSIMLRNTLMFDRFVDQISIIRWSGEKNTRTLVLSARVPQVLLD